MSDTTTDQSGAPASNTGQQQAAKQSDSADAPLGAPGLAALQAERDRAAAQEAARRLAETERDTARTSLATAASERDDFKTRYEALAAKVTDLEPKATKADRYEACHAAGLDPTWWDRLKGSTPEEWLTDAKALAGQVGSKGAGTPAPDGSAGQGAGAGGGSAGSVTGRMDQIRAERAASGRK